MENRNLLVTSDENDQINNSLQELKAEADKLLQILNTASHTISTLEKDLQALSTNIPFRLLIDREETSTNKKPEPYHSSLALKALCYFTQTSRFLAWELDEQSKKFRLLLICEEAEIVSCEHPYDIGRQWLEEYQTKCLSKKPLIETNLQTRLKICEHLNSFILGFKEHLHAKRLAIESANGLPF